MDKVQSIRNLSLIIKTVFMERKLFLKLALFPLVSRICICYNRHNFETTCVCNLKPVTVQDEMWSICKFTFTWKPWKICFYYSKAISSLFSPASETEPQVNTTNFAASRYFHVKAMKDLLLSKQFQVYFRPLQKLSHKWIQSISLPCVSVANKLTKVTFTWKPWKICFF